jgi:hypothetical protein
MGGGSVRASGPLHPLSPSLPETAAPLSSPAAAAARRLPQPASGRLPPKVAVGQGWRDNCPGLLGTEPVESRPRTALTGATPAPSADPQRPLAPTCAPPPRVQTPAVPSPPTGDTIVTAQRCRSQSNTIKQNTLGLFSNAVHTSFFKEPGILLDLYYLTKLPTKLNLKKKKPPLVTE